MISIEIKNKTINDLPEVTLSVVSHGQGPLITNLLDDIAQGIDVSYEIILTLNIPEDELFILKYASLPMKIIRNVTVEGFGANHNAAFAQSHGKYFAIINPDIRFKTLSLRPLLDTLGVEGVGACGPAVYSSGQNLEDSARRFPTLWRFLKRKILRTKNPDYIWQQSAIQVDWLAGMFVVFDRDAYIKVGGFDERYFMYLEDTDICRRLGLAGWRVLLQPSSKVIHDAQRSSRRSLQHLSWHLASAIRFLTSDYKKFKK